MAAHSKPQKYALRSNLAFERLQELLVYEPDTGLFRWRISKGSNSAGSVAGTVLSPTRDYLAIGVDGTRFLAHRLAWFYMTRQWPKADLDHINGKHSDNRWDNLREATRSENCGNARAKSTNKSGFKGVYYDRPSRKWVASITVDGSRFWLGRYHTVREAAEAYQDAAEQQFGKFARTRPLAKPII